MTNEIQATAPTPQDWVELVRENEVLSRKLDIARGVIVSTGLLESYEDLCLELIGVLKGESE